MPTAPDALRLIAEIEERCARLRLHIAGGGTGAAVAATAPPRDGEIRDGRVWVDGRGLYLDPRGQQLLAYAMGSGFGKTPEEVCEEFAWKDRATADKRISELNKLVKKEMKGTPRWPRVGFRGTLHWTWQGQKNQAMA